MYFNDPERAVERQREVAYPGASTEPMEDEMPRDDFNHGELLVLDFQYSRTGSFFSALVNAMHKADAGNLQQLQRAYPELSNAVYSWKNGDLATRLRAADLLD